MIDVERSHGLPEEEARALADSVAAELAAEYRLSWRWRGDHVVFRGVGVNGEMQVDATRVRIRVRLGAPLKVMRPRLEQSIQRRLDAVLSGSGS